MAGELPCLLANGVSPSYLNSRLVFRWIFLMATSNGLAFIISMVSQHNDARGEVSSLSVTVHDRNTGQSGVF